MRNAKIRECLQTLRQKGLPVGAVIDVGIQHATEPLIELFPDVPHVLFEPVEEYFPFIHKNYAALDYKLVHAAVSDAEGFVTLHTQRKTRGDEISHSYIVPNETKSSRTVPTLTLDNYFSSHPLPKSPMLKIDVEGPDVPNSILRGARETLKDCSVVVIEMTVDRFMERAILLHEAGFDLWDLCDLCYYGDCLWQADAIFVNKKHKQDNMELRPMHKQPFSSDLWQSGF